MTTTTTTEQPPRIVELARAVSWMLDDAYTYRTEGTDGTGCPDCLRVRADTGTDQLCEDHATDVELAEGYAQAVHDIQTEAEWAARDTAALDALAEIVRTTTVTASAGELLSRVAAVLVDAGRQVSPTTD